MEAEPSEDNNASTVSEPCSQETHEGLADALLRSTQKEKKNSISDTLMRRILVGDLTAMGERVTVSHSWTPRFMRALKLSFNRHQLMRKACFAKANFIELLRHTLSRRRDGCRPDRFSPRPRQVRSPQDLHYRRRKKNRAHAPPRLPNAWHELLFCNQTARQADEIRAKRCFAQRRHGPPSARTNGTTCSPCNCSPTSLALSRSNTFSTYTLCTAA